MIFPHCPICYTPYALVLSEVGQWINVKACNCPEPPHMQITYSDHTEPYKRQYPGE